MEKTFRAGKYKYTVPQQFSTQEDYAWRVTTAIWRAMLLYHCDKLVINGLPRHLKARALGAGVMEITLVPLKKEVE